MGDWEWSFPEPEGKIGTEPRRERQACKDGNPHSTTAGKEGVGPAAPNPRAPRAPARARVAGGSAASRTSGCCLVAAVARLRSPGRRRRRWRLGSRSQERRHRHGRHQRWAWGAGRRRAGWPPERGGGVPRGPRTPPPRPGRAPRRSLRWRPPPAPRPPPPPPPSQPGSRAGRGALREGPAGSAAPPSAPTFCWSRQPLSHPSAPVQRMKWSLVCESPAAPRAITHVLQEFASGERGERRVVLRGLRPLEMPVTGNQCHFPLKGTSAIFGCWAKPSPSGTPWKDLGTVLSETLAITSTPRTCPRSFTGFRNWCVLICSVCQIGLDPVSDPEVPLFSTVGFVKEIK